jgi:hypothetical protein
VGGAAGFDDRPIGHVQVVGGGPDHPLPLCFGGGVQNHPHPPLYKLPAYWGFVPGSGGRGWSGPPPSPYLLEGVSGPTPHPLLAGHQSLGCGWGGQAGLQKLESGTRLSRSKEAWRLWPVNCLPNYLSLHPSSSVFQVHSGR